MPDIRSSDLLARMRAPSRSRRLAQRYIEVLSKISIAYVAE
jgi:hypothetical protein